MTNSSLSLLGTTPQDVLLGSSPSFVVQNTSKTDTVNYKLKDSTTFGGELKPNEKMEFNADMTFWVNSVSSTVATVLYISKDMISNKLLGSSGAVKQHINDVTPFTIANYYSFNLASGDFMNFSRSSNGQQYTEISMNPLSVGDEQTIIEYKTPFQFPCYSEIEASMSQRVKGQYAVMEITDKDDTFLDTPIEYSVVSSYVNNFGTTVTTGQTTTTLTIAIDSAFDGYLGSWVDLYGFLDNRFNYTNLCVASISTDKKTLTFTVSDEATITSLTANPASVVGAKLKRQAKLLLAGNALGMRFSGTSATATSYLARFGAGSIKETGTMIGAKTITSGSSAVTYTTGGNGQVELKATTRFRLEAEPEVIVFGDRAGDTLGNLTLRNQFTAVKPVGGTDYYVRFRAVTPKSITKPIAKIVSIAKSGTTTATVTTDIPHGLTTASYVQIVGVRDQAAASFPNLTTPTVVSSTPTSTTFTIVIGTASTVTSYGGAVILCNGQVTQQGLIAQAIQSVARDASGLVTLVGSATWAGFGGVGEYVNIYGVRDNTTGADLGVDGVYKVHNAATTTLILEPVKDLSGAYVLNGSGQAVTPTGAVINTTNAGGCVILRTTLRSHDIVLATYTQSQIKIMGQGSYRGDLALPVVHLGSISATTTEGTLVTPSVGTLTTAATTNATSLKTTAGTVYALTFTNTSASAVYLKLYNKATAPTVGTDVPLATIPIPATSFYTCELGRVGLRFATGIGYAITGAITTADTTAITAGSLLTISYI